MRNEHLTKALSYEETYLRREGGGGVGFLIPFQAGILEKLIRHILFKQFFRHHGFKRDISNITYRLKNRMALTSKLVFATEFKST